MALHIAIPYSIWVRVALFLTDSRCFRKASSPTSSPSAEEAEVARRRPHAAATWQSVFVSGRTPASDWDRRSCNRVRVRVRVGVRVRVRVRVTVRVRVGVRVGDVGESVRLGQDARLRLGAQ